MSEPAPMRVVMVLGKSTGGIGTHVADLAGRLRGQGHRVLVATDELTATTFDLGQSLKVWPTLGGAKSPSALAQAGRRELAGLGALRRTIRGAEVVHAHGHQAGLLAALAIGSLRPKARPVLVVSLHNEAATGAGARRTVTDAAQRFVAARAALITGASSDLVERARQFGAQASLLALVPSPRVPQLLAATPADRDRARALIRERLGLDVEAPLIVTISRIAPQKDLDTLLRAARALDGRRNAAPTREQGGVGWTWAVIGGGIPQLRARLEAEAAAQGLPIRFVGAVSDPTAWLLGGDVFVLTSTWEARALVVQEAMAAGVPVVASDSGGLPDLLGPAATPVGCLVPVGDAAGFADAVARLLADADTRHTEGLLARERARSWPDSDESAAWWADMYRRLLWVS